VQYLYWCQTLKLLFWPTVHWGMIGLRRMFHTRMQHRTNVPSILKDFGSMWHLSVSITSMYLKCVGLKLVNSQVVDKIICIQCKLAAVSQSYFLFVHFCQKEFPWNSNLPLAHKPPKNYCGIFTFPHNNHSFRKKNLLGC